MRKLGFVLTWAWLLACACSPVQKGPPGIFGPTGPRGVSDGGASHYDFAVAGSTACMPDCTGRDCGDDGCGGSCGHCDSTKVCRYGLCIAGGNCSAEPCSAGVDRGGCCSGTPYCTSLFYEQTSPPPKTCSSECGVGGFTCVDDGDCCSGYSCLAGACSTTAMCGGESCFAHANCCADAPYCTGQGIAPTCSSSCGAPLDFCKDDADCCQPAKCERGQCKGEVGVACQSSLQCADGTACAASDDTCTVCEAQLGDACWGCPDNC